MNHTPSRARLVPRVVLVVFAAWFIWSAITPRDRFTWMLEVLPAVIGCVLLVAMRRRFAFTSLAYVLMGLHAIILVVGGHYTYAEVPLFNWLRDHFHLERNAYDRVGHFAQGFVPAILAREVLLRRSPLHPGKWLWFLVTCVCLAISAAYELIEWLVARTTGTAAEAFLGTQGDPWDTQWDMALALVGALAAQFLLSRYHDRALAAMAAATRIEAAP